MKFICFVCITIVLVTKPYGKCDTSQPPTIRVHTNTSELFHTSRLPTIRVYTNISELFQRYQNTNKTTPKVDPTPEKFLTFCKTITKRLDLDIDLARYKWKHGVHVKLPQELYNDILVNAKEHADKVNLVSTDAVQFIMDVIEAGTIIQYTLISNWYANVNRKDKILPDGPEVELGNLYQEMRLHETFILEEMTALKKLRMSRTCNEVISPLVKLSIWHAESTLKRIALQTTMIHFCEIFHPHENPWKGWKVPTKKHTHRRPRYRRKTTIHPLSTTNLISKNGSSLHLFDSISSDAELALFTTSSY